jgi:hypothetical protein
LKNCFLIVRRSFIFLRMRVSDTFTHAQSRLRF